MSTIGVAGIERVAALVGSRNVPTSRSSTRRSREARSPAAQGQLDDLRVGARRGPRPRHSALRRARPAHHLGRSGRERDASQAREQHVAGVRRRGGRRVGCARAPVGARHRDGRRRARRRPTRVAVAGGQAPTHSARATSHRSSRWRSRSRTCTSRSRRPTTDRFAALACLADEWQRVVDQGLGDQDLTVVTRALELEGGTR